jgi:hypothetical protein
VYGAKNYSVTEHPANQYHLVLQSLWQAQHSQPSLGDLTLIQA